MNFGFIVFLKQYLNEKHFRFSYAFVADSKTFFKIGFCRLMRFDYINYYSHVRYHLYIHYFPTLSKYRNYLHWRSVKAVVISVSQAISFQILLLDTRHWSVLGLHISGRHQRYRTAAICGRKYFYGAYTRYYIVCI